MPSSYNGFLYPIDGEIVVDGARPERLATGQIGWLEFGGPSKTVRLTAGTNGSRVLLYAGERQMLLLRRNESVSMLAEQDDIPCE